jgi:diguanylate cyclase (GGDEF)-like protein
MKDSISLPRVYLRSDSRTGAENLLAFFEWLLAHTREENFTPFTLISIDVVGLRQLNDEYGFAAGDAVLRWVTLVLQEEAGAKVYRIGGDEFVGVLSGGSKQDHADLCNRVLKRLEDEADQVKLSSHPAHAAMIHFANVEENSPEDFLGIVYGAMLEVKNSPDRSFKVYDEMLTLSETTRVELINDMIRRMVSLESILDKSLELANTDSLSGLPNMLAAEEKCQSMVELSGASNRTFTLLLLDGDDLKNYNNISYLAGDKMITRLGKVLADEMRPTDFVARWRTGDEFLILLPDTIIDQALRVGDRLREAVSTGSQDWEIPITISIGVAGYPEHGRTVEDLIQQAEKGLKKAKEEGKNQVCVA